MEQKYKYYAFISYNRKDEEWARWIQFEFEHYHLPSILNGRDDLPAEFRPVFRDIDELSAGNLPKQIYEALFMSRFLIVICSPDAAKSKWVNKEIHDFIEIGKLNGINNIDNIFPFIVGGKPHAESSEDECFPPILKNLNSKDERIGGNVLESGRDMAFIKVLSGTLNIGFDLLWNRYEKEKIAEEERKRSERDNLLILQSRVLSEKAEKWIEEGNSLRAALVLLKALPNNINDPDDRPLLAKAERLLRDVVSYKSIRISGRINDSTIFLKNRTLISLEEDGSSILLWNIDTGKYESLRPDIYEDVMCATFSPSGRLIICVTTASTIIVWDFESRSLLWQRSSDVNTYNDISFDFSSDEKSVLIKDGGYLHIYDIFRNEIYRSYAVDSEEIDKYEKHIQKFNPAVREDDIYTIISDRKLKIMSRTTDECLICITDLFTDDSIATYNPNDSRIIYTTAFNKLKSLCVATGEMNLIDYRVSYPIRTIGIMPESKEILLSSKDGKCEVIPADRYIVSLPRPRLSCHQISPDSKYVAAIILNECLSYSIGIWNIPQAAGNSGIVKPRLVTESQLRISKITISPDSRKIAALYVNNTIRIFLMDEGNSIELSKAHNDVINDMIFSPCGRYFITASDDCTIKLWGSGNFEQITAINTPRIIQYLDCSYDGEYILGTQSINVRLFSISQQKCIKTFKTGRTYAKARFSPCNKYIISQEEYRIKVYEISSGKRINEFGYHRITDYTDVSVPDNIVGYGVIDIDGDFIIAYEEGDIYKGNIYKTDIEHIGRHYTNLYSSNFEVSKSGEYLLLGNRLMRLHFPVTNVQESLPDNPDDYDESEFTEFDNEFSSPFDLTKPYEQEEKDSVVFEHLVSLALEENYSSDLLPIKVSKQNNVLIQDKNSKGGFIINNTTHSVKKVSSFSEEDYEHISIFQNRYSLEIQENKVSVIDISSQENIGVLQALDNERIMDATFSIKGNYIVFLSEFTDGMHIYFREFKPIQQLIDEMNSRYRGCELTETERSQCYLD
ncbi:MAG: TIR domain-containing protein [Candidatus Cryptobacteroides sp.]